MWQHIGACRFIWNYMLDLQEQRYRDGEKHLSCFDTMKQLVLLKRQEEYQWIYGVSNATLQLICIDLSKAYDKFFRKQSKPPKFKSRKRSSSNFPVRADGVWFSVSQVHIEKLGKVKYKCDCEPPLGRSHQFINPRIT